jgi:hypothetical protein
MAEKLDKRIIIVEIEVPGGKKRLEGISCDFTVTKTAGGLMNEAEIRIANLAKADRDYIVTATSPLRRPRQRKSITIWAGYESTGVTRRFSGDITDASVTQPPDIWLIVKAKTGYHARGDLVSRSASAQSNLSQLAADIAGDLDLDLDFQATDKAIANYSFTGGKLLQVDKLGQAGMVDAYVDDDRLVVKERGKGLAGRIRKLSEKTGMIGVPEVDEKGVKVKMLMDQHTNLGTTLEITSKLNPAANGSFVIYKMRDNCSMRGLPFYIEAEALRPGLGGMAP